MPVNKRTREVYEVVEMVANVNKLDERVKILQDNDSWAIRDLISLSMNPKFVWLLPDTPPPYTPAPEKSYPTSLLRENKKFKFFIKNLGYNDLSQMKRERIFISILEGIHPEDAKILIKVLKKEQIGKGFTKTVIAKAFPDLDLGNS